MAFVQGGVLAGMSDGAVARYGAEEAGLPAEGHAYLCLRALNKSAFGLTDSDPRQRPAPVTCMLLIGCGSQVRLWPRPLLIFLFPLPSSSSSHPLLFLPAPSLSCPLPFWLSRWLLPFSIFLPLHLFFLPHLPSSSSSSSFISL